jgi:hypothetical protein
MRNHRTRDDSWQVIFKITYEFKLENGTHSLEGLSQIYKEEKKLNWDFGQRMIAASRSDANVHALVKLNVSAVMVPVTAENMVKEMTPYFSSYLK